MKRLEAESITDKIIRAVNISNSSKEGSEVISDGLLIAMVLKGLPSNFKPFVTVYRKAQLISEFKVC